MEHVSNDELEAAQVTANVLESSAMIRAHQQEISSKLAEVAQQRIELAGSAEGALVGEMRLMADRMQQLYDHSQHRWRSRRVGKSVLSVMEDERYKDVYNMTALKTSPVPDGMIGVHEGKELVVSGLVYSSGFYDHAFKKGTFWGGDIDIFRSIENQNLQEASDEQKLYSLSTYNDEVGRRIQASGSEFDSFKEVQENYMSMLAASHSDNIVAILRTAHLSRRREDYVLPADDMYLKPLTLVMQGNMLLGAKRKQP